MSAADVIGEEQAWVTAMPEALRGPAQSLNKAVVEPAMNKWYKVEQKVRVLRDRFAPLRKERWAFAAALLFIYFLRVYFAQGWYIVTYALGIYILNLVIGFLTPQWRVTLLQDLPVEAEADGVLPTNESGEFRPFMRRLPEEKFWYSLVRGVAIAFCMTLFEAFDIPVFWPILVLYFIVLLFITMRRQIQHMIKHHYIPVDMNKPAYNK